VETERVYQPPPLPADSTTPTAPTLEERLRGALASAAGAVGHETLRFTLLVRALPTLAPSAAAGDGAAAAAAEVCGLLAEAAGALVSATQLATKRALCGAPLRAETRAVATAVIAALRSMVAPLAAATSAPKAATGGRGLGDALRAAAARHGDAMLYHAGMVGKAVDRVKLLPRGDVAAARRKLLSAAKVMKVSATEIREEHAGDDFSGGGGGSSGGGGGGGAAAAAAAAVAKTIHEDADEDDDDAADEKVEEYSGAARAAVIEAGIAALKAAFGAMQRALAVVDVVAAPLVAPPTDASGWHTDAASVAARGALDGVAAAAVELEDVIVDVAAAVNDCDARELPVVAEALAPVMTAFEAAIGDAAAVVPPPTVAVDAVLEAFRTSWAAAETAAAALLAVSEGRAAVGNGSGGSGGGGGGGGGGAAAAAAAAAAGK